MTNRLDELRRRYDNSVQIRILVCIVRPEVKIIKCANNQHADLVVMDSRCLKEIFKFLMGSVSRTV
ncbi:MAG TPA: universal stress protein [Nitrososphaeraceae archaeon]|nr:universal stress protein [Nitrososphaeraceae archaeon]